MFLTTTGYLGTGDLLPEMLGLTSIPRGSISPKSTAITSGANVRMQAMARPAASVPAKVAHFHQVCRG